MEFKGLRWDDMDSGIQDLYEAYTKQDIKLEADIFCRLMETLTRPEIELPLAHHTLELFTRPQLMCDFKLGRKLLIQMNRQLRIAVAGTGHTAKELGGTLSFTKMMIDAMPPGETIPLKKGKPTKNQIPMTGEGMIGAFAKDDPGMLALIKHSDPLVSLLATARVEMSSWPNWIKRVKSIGVQSSLLGGYFPIPLIYYGCHTGRASGGEGLNVQNLGARVNDLINQIRHMMIAPEYFTLVMVDLTAIEARMLAWMVQDERLLHQYREGIDVYCDFASRLFKETVINPKNLDPGSYKTDMAGKRGTGKTAILGCGYGMGWKTFLERLVVLKDLQDRVAAGEIDGRYSKNCIETYRRTYPLIPEYWGKIENCYRWVTKYPRKTRELYPGLKFWHTSGTTHIQLPSSRVLYYPEARVTSTYDKFSRPKDTIHWKYGPIWGGFLTENIDQAMSRDILMEAILKWEQSGRRVALHVHDEIVTRALKVCAEEVKADLIDVMTELPAWAEGLPMDAEGVISEHYTK